MPAEAGIFFCGLSSAFFAASYRNAAHDLVEM
jgi:hypothetical protein